MIAPDQRGYGQTDCPPEVEEYTQLHLVGDLVGLLDAFGIDTRRGRRPRLGRTGRVALRVAPARSLRRRGRAQRALRRDRAGADAVASSRPRRMRAALGDTFLYILYFQEPGVAERELDADLRRSLRLLPLRALRRHPARPVPLLRPDREDVFDILAEPPGPLDWLSDDDLDVFVDSFAHHGTFFGGLNWYRCIDRTSELLGAVRRASDHAAGAVHRRGVRLDLRSDAGVGARDA